MAEMKHTAGIIGAPWFYEITDEILGRTEGGAVFVVAQINPLAEMTQQVTDDHARLIAAAPDLLEAAQKVLAGLNARIDAAPLSAKPVFNGIAELSDAISKATSHNLKDGRE